VLFSDGIQDMPGHQFVAELVDPSQAIAVDVGVPGVGKFRGDAVLAGIVGDDVEQLILAQGDLVLFKLLGQGLDAGQDAGVDGVLGQALLGVGVAAVHGQGDQDDQDDQEHGDDENGLTVLLLIFCHD
jgi:hypothetical protein